MLSVKMFDQFSYCISKSLKTVTEGNLDLNL